MKEYFILKYVELPCAGINDESIWRWMLYTLGRPPELNRTQSQTMQTSKVLNESFVNMLISNWKKSLFKKKWKPEENVDRKIINHGNSIMNQNNRCNMNNSIFYKQKLDCSVSLIGKANMPKINFPEYLSFMFYGQCCPAVTKNKMWMIYIPEELLTPKPHFPDGPHINNCNHFPWLYSGKNILYSHSGRSKVQVIHPSVISWFTFSFLLFLLTG